YFGRDAGAETVSRHAIALDGNPDRDEELRRRATREYVAHDELFGVPQNVITLRDLRGTTAQAQRGVRHGRGDELLIELQIAQDKRNVQVARAVVRLSIESFEITGLQRRRTRQSSQDIAGGQNLAVNVGENLACFLVQVLLDLRPFGSCGA